MNANGKTFAIAVLCLTAVLMTCTLLILDRMPTNVAQAAGPGDRQGDYILVPGGTIRSVDVVYVIDMAARKLAAYSANMNTSRIEAKATFDLALLDKLDKP